MTTLAATLVAATLLGQAAPPAPLPVRTRRDRAVPPARVAPRIFQPSKAMARRLFARGRALFAKRRYRRAIAALEQALRHWNRRELHFNIALCYYELRDDVGTVRHLRAYLRGASQSEKRAVPLALRRLRRKVGVVVVESNEPEAVIRIDGVMRGRGKVEWVVRPGQVQVVIHREGVAALERTMLARAGGTTYWDVTVDRIRVVGPGSGRRPKPLHWQWFAVAAGTAVGAAIVAVGLGVKTHRLHQDFDANPTWATRSEGIRYQTLTNVLWGVAGAAAVTAAVLAYFTRWKRRERPEARRIVPVLTPTGVAVTGRF
jgi:hypothetical protein